jgi:hypothetical protein
MAKMGEVEMQGFSSCKSTSLGFHTITLPLALFPAQPKVAYLGDQSLLYGVPLSIQSLSYLTTSERITVSILVYAIGSR